MTSPVTPVDLRLRATRLFARDARRWAAECAADIVLDVPLHPPTERAVLDDVERARAWVDSWRAAFDEVDVELVWGVRDWSRVGAQRVPLRAIVRGPDAIARVAGESSTWHVLVDRLDALRPFAGGLAADVLRSQARTVTLLSDADFRRLVDVVAWLRENPASGRLVRELPIRGVDTKWIEGHRGLVGSLHRAGTGRPDLGLREPSPLVRLRALDPALAYRGVRDLSAPVDDLAALPVEAERIFVFENLATVIAMPDVAGGMVVHGGGHRIDLVARLPWVRQVTYWGDLDSHGFAILHRLRSHGVVADSVLMDVETLVAHRDLWGQDPTPNTAALPLLTAEESRALGGLSAEGNVRLEQERIPWEYAIPRLSLTPAR